jgi:hypothetical protein
MGTMAILDPAGQKAAVAMLFARMCCRVPEGPCQVCIDFCTEWIVPRAYPVIKQALMTSVRSGLIEEGFGALMVGVVYAAPNNSPPLEEEHRG